MEDSAYLVDQRLEGLHQEIVRLRRTVTVGFVAVGVLLFGGLYLPPEPRLFVAAIIVVGGCILYLVGTIYLAACRWRSRRAAHRFART